MSYQIDWRKNFYGISWAHEKDRLVLSLVFEDKIFLTLILLMGFFHKIQCQILKHMTSKQKKLFQ